MSGGLSALRGFEYQAIVTLDILLTRFKARAGVVARPEGDDDLVIAHSSDDAREHFQIKKPREDAQGRPAPKPWTLSKIVSELLPGSITRLRSTRDTQAWVLGDAVDADVVTLLRPGQPAPDSGAHTYNCTLHLLARNASKVGQFVAGPNKTERRKRKTALERWRPSSEGEGTEFVDAFLERASEYGVQTAVCQQYRDEVRALHAILPGVLERIQVQSTFGSESDISQRVVSTLAAEYGLSAEVVRYAVLRNLRGFIVDISTQADRWFEKEEFELELKSVWPRMSLVAAPPAPLSVSVPRMALVEELVSATVVAPTEVVGSSGAGKTQLAGAVARRLESDFPDSKICYMEVRQQSTVRDVLAGVAFHLRRVGITAPFSMVVEHAQADETALRMIGRALRSVASRFIMLLDLVDGGCSDSFARDLGAFIIEAGSSLRLLVLGQESSFRGLTILERSAVGIGASHHLGGLDFDEFVALVGAHQEGAPPRAELWSVFESASGGRSAGVLARLASTLAQQPLRRMKALAELEPEAALAEADRARYEAIPAVLRPSADRLVCFALPFSRTTAELCFPDDHVGDAMRELVKRGLLRVHDGDLYEMHETVRAGLEALSRPAARAESHSRLADFYVSRDEPLAAIHHLDRAGLFAKAHELAKSEFLGGRRRPALAPYVARHNLIPDAEVLEWLKAPELPKDHYVLRQLLGASREQGTADELLAMIRLQSERFGEDYRWAWLMTELVLVCDGSRLHDLVVFALEGDRDKVPVKLEMLQHGIRRVPVQVDSRLMALFKKQQDEIKVRLVSPLLRDFRRDVLRPVLEFVASFAGTEEQEEVLLGSPGIPRSFSGLTLSAESDVVELLASLPVVEPSAMIAQKGVLLGRVESWLWPEREFLRAHCAVLLLDTEQEELILENALRVLAFLDAPQAVERSQRFWERKGRLGTFALFVPALHPACADKGQFRAVLFDTAQDIGRRWAMFSLLLHLGEPPDSLFAEVCDADPTNRKGWEFALAMSVSQYPCASAVPVVEAMLAESGKQTATALVAPLLLKLGELEDPSVTSLLVRACEAPDPTVRLSAYVALQSRRDANALESLLERCHQESDPRLRQVAIVAAIASYPESMGQFDGVWEGAPQSTLWRCILAGRLRARSELPNLVALATDASQRWQVRRAAILAVAQCRDVPSLEQIAEAVLSESSPLELDHSNGLLSHNHLAWLVQEEAKPILSRSPDGRSRFVDCFGEILDTWSQGCLSVHGAAAGRDAADWLFDRLETHGWPPNPRAADRIVDELHIPILHAAVFRGLRLAELTGRLEELLDTAGSHWTLVRLICEWHKGRRVSPADHAAFAEAVRRNPHADSPFVQNALRNSEPAKPKPRETALAEPAAKFLRLTYAEVQQVLESGTLEAGTPVILADLDVGQFDQLVQDLDPSLDRLTTWKPVTPSLRFTFKGFSVAGARQDTYGKHIEVRARLRPALAAANRFRHPIPWHRDRLLSTTGYRNDEAKEYVANLVASFGAQGDAGVWGDELERNGDVIVPYLAPDTLLRRVNKLFDERFIPLVSRLANAGPDSMLEILCAVVRELTSPEIDPVLGALFHRWVGRFNPKDSRVQHERNHSIWQAFSSMIRHPRFRSIVDYDLRLAQVLACQLTWYNKRDIVDAIGDSRRMYIQHEMMLFKAAPFEHYHRDEVDRLDDAADQLFGKRG